MQVVQFPAPLFAKIIQWIVFILISAMSVVIFSQILYRKLFNGSIPWSEELARYLFVWTAWLGAAIGVKRGAHFGVDLLVKSFPVLLRRLTRIVVMAVAVFFLCVAIWKGFDLSINNWFQKSPAMRIPMTFPYLSVPVGAFFMLYFLLIGYFEERSQ